MLLSDPLLAMRLTSLTIQLARGRCFRSVLPAATSDHFGEHFSPAYSSELGLMLLTFGAVRGCVLLLHR